LEWGCWRQGDGGHPDERFGVVARISRLAGWRECRRSLPCRGTGVKLAVVNRNGTCSRDQGAFDRMLVRPSGSADHATACLSSFTAIASG